MHRYRHLGMFALSLCLAFWLATVAVGLTMIQTGAEGSGLGVVEGLLRASSITVTIVAAVFYVGRLARGRFEYGYLAAQRDGKPARVTSIASHAASEKDPVQDR